MIIVPVDVRRRIKGYPSALAALAAAKAHPLQGKARSDGAMLAGQSFLEGRASSSRWCIAFTGSLWLDVEAADDAVAWRVTREPPVFEAQSEPYTLRWPSGRDSVIDPAKLSSDRVGASFWQLWVNEGGFYVYLRHKLILCFHAVRRTDNNECTLAVHEDH